MSERVNMRDRVHIGQSWQRRRGGEIGVIRQIHRADRQVELLGIHGVRLVTFTDLRTKYRQVEPSSRSDSPGDPLAAPAAQHDAVDKVNPQASSPFTQTAGAASPTLPKPRPRPFWTPSNDPSDLEFFMAHPINPKEANAMPLPTSKTSREARDPRDARVLLVAPPKTGKTTLAAAWAPDTTLILDTHQGTRLLDGDHYVQPISTFPDFETAVNELATSQHTFRTVVVDLVEDIWQYAKQAAAQAHGKVSAGAVEYGKGTDHAEAIFRTNIGKLLALPVGVWFLSHVETIQDENKITYIPKIDKRVRTYIEGAVDFALLGEIKGTDRVLQTAPSARYQIGSRVPLPNPMPLDARKLYVAIANGLAANPKPVEQPAPAAPAPVQNQPQEAVAA